MPDFFVRGSESDLIYGSPEIEVKTDAAYNWYLIGVYGRSAWLPIKRWVVYEQWHNMTEDFSIYIDALVPDTYHYVSLYFNTEPSFESAQEADSRIVFTTISYEGIYKNSATIVYDPNGGTGAPEAQTFSSDTSSLTGVISADVPQKEGFTFLYWFLQSDIYGARDSFARFYPGDEIWLYGAGREWTLYAAWGKAVNIHNGETFVKALPYIYHDGAWRQAIPYVHNGTEWISTN